MGDIKCAVNHPGTYDRESHSKQNKTKQKSSSGEAPGSNTEMLGRGSQAETGALDSAPAPCIQIKDSAVLLHVQKDCRSLESYTVLEFCLATDIFNFAARRVPQGTELLLPHVTPPLPVYSPAFLFFLLPPNKIENFITSVRKLNPREQSDSSEHPFPGKEPILEYNFANALRFSEVLKGCKTESF